MSIFLLGFIIQMFSFLHFLFITGFIQGSLMQVLVYLVGIHLLIVAYMASFNICQFCSTEFCSGLDEVGS